MNQANIIFKNAILLTMDKNFTKYEPGAIAISNDKILAVGGSYNLQEHVGPFYYAADRNFNESARTNYNARLIFIPTKNNIYTANIDKWTVKMGE